MEEEEELAEPAALPFSHWHLQHWLPIPQPHSTAHLPLHLLHLLHLLQRLLVTRGGSRGRHRGAGRNKRAALRGGSKGRH